jgi:hypothetical protein
MYCRPTTLKEIDKIYYICIHYRHLHYNYYDNIINSSNFYTFMISNIQYHELLKLSNKN